MLPKRRTATTALLAASAGLLALGLPHAADADPSPSWSLDPTYGESGTATLLTGSADPTVADHFAFASDTDEQGRMVLGLQGAAGFDITRLTADGHLDTAFGNSGTVTLGFTWVSAIATSSHGTVVSGLLPKPTESDPTASVAAIVRLLPDGTGDAGFGTSALVEVGPTGVDPAGVTALGLASNGDVIAAVAGSSTTAHSTTLRRFDAAGAPKAGFGVNGVVTIAAPEGGSVDVWDFEVDSADGVVATVSPVVGEARTTVARHYLASGSVDSGFGTAGSAALGSGTGYEVALSSTNETAVALKDAEHTVVWELTPAGLPDPAFSSDGKLVIDSDAIASALPWGLVWMPGGDLAVLTGHFGYDGPSEVDMLHPDGSFNAEFGTAGRLVVEESIARGSLGLGSEGRLLLQSGWRTDGDTVVRKTTVRAYEAPATTKPAITAVGAHPGALSVSWDAPESVSNGPIRAYYLAALQGGVVKSQQIVAGDVRQGSLSGLTNGTAYTVVVLPYTASGPLTASDTSTGTPLANAPAVAAASAVRDVAATTGKGFATVTWNPPAGDGGSPISGYSVVAMDHATNTLFSWRNVRADLRTAAVPGLIAGKTYDIYVVASTGFGFGTVAPAVTATPTGTSTDVATAPDVAWASAVSGGGSNIVVTWGPPVEHGQIITKVNVVVMQGGVMKVWKALDPTVRQQTYHLDTAAPAQVYVFAEGAAGYGPFHGPIAVGSAT